VHPRPDGGDRRGQEGLKSPCRRLSESEQSWKELLLDVKARGLEIEPSLDRRRALGFWKAMRHVWDTTKSSGCWVHKMANIWTSCPRAGSRRPRRRCMRSTGRRRRPSGEAFELFVKTYVPSIEGDGVPGEGQGGCSWRSRVPGGHWVHIRTTTRSMSVFSTVRLRHDKTKGAGAV